jgi:anti-sigma-K factor RskA
MSVQGHELHLLTGAYAADAVTGAELAEFEKHLERCSTCTEEVRGLRETAARLGMVTAIAPPPGMKDQVLAAASRTRQLPPSSRKLLALGAPRRITPRRVATGRVTRMRRVVPRPVAVGAMSAMAAAIVVLAVFQVNTRDQLQQAQAGDHAIAAVLAAPDARIETGTPSVGGTVTAVFSRSDSQAVVTTADMPDPGGGKVYQLWVINTAGARSAGLISGSSANPTSPVLADDVKPGDWLGITVEPAGGSGRPTTTPVVLLSAHT